MDAFFAIAMGSPLILNAHAGSLVPEKLPAGIGHDRPANFVPSSSGFFLHRAARLASEAQLASINGAGLYQSGKYDNSLSLGIVRFYFSFQSCHNIHCSAWICTLWIADKSVSIIEVECSLAEM